MQLVSRNKFYKFLVLNNINKTKILKIDTIFSEYHKKCITFNYSYNNKKVCVLLSVFKDVVFKDEPLEYKEYYFIKSNNVPRSNKALFLQKMYLSKILFRCRKKTFQANTVQIGNEIPNDSAVG